MDAAADPLAGLTMSYESLVEAGREARHQADNVQWTEGDLALQVEHLPSTERPRNSETGEFLASDESALKQYAADIDVPYSTIRGYRTTADSWPPDRRLSGVGFETHRALNSQDDRFDLIHPGMSARDAKAIVRRRNSASRGKPGWFELLGEVGDTVIKAGKQLDKFEAAVGDDEFHEDLRAKAAEYATWADELGNRLREFAA